MNDINEIALKAIYQVSECFGKVEEPRKTIQDILEILNEALGYSNGMVTMVEPETGDLLIEAACGADQEKWGNVRYRKGEGITGLILQTGNPLAIRQIKNDPRFLNRLGVYNPECAFLGIPIQVGDNRIGVFSITLDANERYRLDQHLQITIIFANLIGSVMSRLIKVEREKEVIIREKDQLQRQLKKRYRPDNMVGVSKVMHEVFDLIRQVARWNTTVLIRGESGTGKELVAKGIHYQSPRNKGPFVKLNCAALPDTLLESELFGHEKGAFTGAVRKRPGRFEQANHGTLFLDEIGDTTMAFQAKLLRVLQEGQFERLGGEETLTVDVRIITATNVDLEKAVAEKQFREDLYYRLNVMPIFLSPLRERKEDIPYLVEFFLDSLSKECGQRLSLVPETLRILQECTFPGNVRELENCLHRAAVTCKGNSITPLDLPCTTRTCLSRTIAQMPDINKLPETVQTSSNSSDFSHIFNERERVVAALRQSGWVQAKAARLLNMTPRQIAYRIQKLHIEMENF